MFKLVISDDEGKTTSVPLVRDEITVGRQEGNTIRLTDRNVSRRHAKLQKQNGNYLLFDLGSYNGTVINGARLTDSRSLKHGDQIVIGDYKLAILEEHTGQIMAPPPNGNHEPTLEALPAAGHVPPPPPTAPGIPSVMSAQASPAMGMPGAGPQPNFPPSAAPSFGADGGLPENLRGMRLMFLSPQGAPPVVELRKLPMILGRKEDADVSLPFSSISREHARLFLQGEDLCVEDLGSSNGVLVNGSKVRKQKLMSGDLVTLGVVEFRVAKRGDETVVMATDIPGLERRSPVPMVLGALAVVAVLTGVGLGIRSRGTTPEVAHLSPTTSPPTPTAPTNTPPTVPTTPTPENPPQIAGGQEPVDPPSVPTPAPTGNGNPEPVAPRPRNPRPSHANPAVAATPNPPAANPNPPAPNPAPRPPPTTPTANAANNANLLEQARDLIRSGNNQGVIDLYRSRNPRTLSQEELGLLATTHRSLGNRAQAERTMNLYLTRFPEGRLASSFRDYLAP